MAVRVWLVAIMLIGQLTLGVLIFTPVFNFIVNTMNASATVTGDAQTSLNTVVTMVKWAWGITMGIECIGLIIWAMVSPQRREMESYMND